jgi:hypothetical protein
VRLDPAAADPSPQRGAKHPTFSDRESGGAKGRDGQQRATHLPRFFLDIAQRLD